MGGLLFGWIADRYGRIPSLMGANVLGAVAGIGTAFTHDFWSFTVCRFFVGFAFDNCFTLMYILGKAMVKRIHKKATKFFLIFFSIGVCGTTMENFHRKYVNCSVFWFGSMCYTMDSFICE